MASLRKYSIPTSWGTNESLATVQARAVAANEDTAFSPPDPITSNVTLPVADNYMLEWRFLLRLSNPWTAWNMVMPDGCDDWMHVYMFQSDADSTQGTEIASVKQTSFTPQSVTVNGTVSAGNFGAAASDGFYYVLMIAYFGEIAGGQRGRWQIGYTPQGASAVAAADVNSGSHLLDYVPPPPPALNINTIPRHTGEIVRALFTCDDYDTSADRHVWFDLAAGDGSVSADSDITIPPALTINRIRWRTSDNRFWIHQTPGSGNFNDYFGAGQPGRSKSIFIAVSNQASGLTEIDVSQQTPAATDTIVLRFENLPAAIGTVLDMVMPESVINLVIADKALAAATPEVPATPSVGRIGDTQVTVSWAEPDGDPTSYDLQWRQGNSGPWTTVEDLTSTLYVLSSLTASTAYQVRVRASNAGGDSNYSEAQSFTTATAGTRPPTTQQVYRKVRTYANGYQKRGAWAATEATAPDPAALTLVSSVVQSQGRQRRAWTGDNFPGIDGEATAIYTFGSLSTGTPPNDAPTPAPRTQSAIPSGLSINSQWQGNFASQFTPPPFITRRRSGDTTIHRVFFFAGRNATNTADAYAVRATNIPNTNPPSTLTAGTVDTLSKFRRFDTYEGGVTVTGDYGTANPPPANSAPPFTESTESDTTPAVTINTAAQNVASRAQLMLDATVVDPDSTNPTLSWTATGGSFADAAVEDAVWTAPANNTSAIVLYTLTLTAHDGASQHSDSVVIGVEPANMAPTVTINTVDQVIVGSNSIALVVAVNDPDDDALTISWASSPTAGSFNDSAIAQPVWTAPAAGVNAQTIVLTVTVSDGIETVTDSVTFTVPARPTINTIPYHESEVIRALITCGNFTYSDADREWLNITGDSGSVSEDSDMLVSGMLSINRIRWNTSDDRMRMNPSGTGTFATHFGTSQPGREQHMYIAVSARADHLTDTDLDGKIATADASVLQIDDVPDSVADILDFVRPGSIINFVISDEALLVTPSVPATPTTGTIGPTSAVINWTEPAGQPASYDLQWRQGTSGAWSHSEEDIEDTTFTITDLNPGVQYQARVRATNAIGSSNYSTPVTFTTSAAPGRPVAPTIGTRTSRSAVINWTPPANNPQTYDLRWRVSGASEFSEAEDLTGTTHTITSLIPGTSYLASVRASNNLGDGRYSPEASFTTLNDVPERPEEPASSQITDETATITWVAPRNNGAAILDYTLRYKKTADTNWQEVTLGNVTTHGLVNLDATTQYEVQVRARNSLGNSQWSPSHTFSTIANLPPAVSISTQTMILDGGQTIELVGTANDPDGVIASTAWTGAGTFSAPTALTTNWTAPDSQATNRQYALTLTATDDDGSTNSAVVDMIVRAYAVPDAPAQPTISDITRDSARVTWVAPAANNSPISGYDIRYKKTADATWSEDDVGNVLTTVLASLDLVTEYEVQVRARNVAGAGGWSDSAVFTTNRPPQVTIATAAQVVNSRTRIQLSATVSDPDGTIASTAWASTGGRFVNTSVVNAIWDAPVARATDVSYTLTLTATDDDGDSTSASVIITVRAYAVPDAPILPTITDLEPFHVEVNWGTPNDNFSPITGYQVRYRQVGALTWNIENVDVVLSYILAPLVQDADYETQVRAGNAAGFGGWSPLAFFTTPALEVDATGDPEPDSAWRVELYEESSNTFLDNTPAVESVTRLQRLDGMSEIDIAFPAVHPFCRGLREERRLRVFHNTAGYLGTFVIREVDQAIYDTDEVVSIKGYDLLIDLAEVSTFINRNYNGVPVEQILSNQPITDNPDGLLRGTRVTSEIESGLGEFTVSYNGESRLAAVAAVADRLKLHFRLKPAGPGASPVLQFGSFGQTKNVVLAGMRQITQAAEMNEHLLPIVDIDNYSHNYERTDYLMPLGSGTGNARLTLQHATATDSDYPIREFTLPDGSTGYYVRHVDTPDIDLVAPGGSNHFYELKESAIRPITNAPGHVAVAADALYKTAVGNLKVRRVRRQVYTLTVAGHAPISEELVVGDRITVFYRGVVRREADQSHAGQYRWVNIDGLFYIIEITEIFDQEGGVHTVFKLSNTGEPAADERTLTLDLMRRADVLEKYVQLSSNIAHLNFDDVAEPYAVWQDRNTGGQSQLDRAASAGSRTIFVQVSQATGYSVGDYIRVGDRSEEEMEVYRITAVNRSSRALTLDVPLLRDHANGDEVIEQEDDSVGSTPFYVPIGLGYYDLQNVTMRLTTRQGITTTTRVATGASGSHDHSSSEAGGHTHAISSDSAGSHSHGSAGGHSHGAAGGHSHTIPNSDGIARTASGHTHAAAGSHVHGGSASNVGGHTHGLQITIGTASTIVGSTNSGGGHSHTVTIQSSGSHSHASGGSHSHAVTSFVGPTASSGGHSHSAAADHSHGSAGSHSHGGSASSAGAHRHSITNSGSHTHGASVRVTSSSVFPAMLEILVNNVDITRTVVPASVRGPWGTLDQEVENFILDLTPYFHDDNGNLLQQFHKIEVRPRAGFGEIIVNIDLHGIIQAVAVQ